ncbi:hypothetical protein [Pseudogemmobacter bohemicus]|uniref:hypothetical protein n=1 Tax=Pseudogemmobacter bohemicus TaxID=2250708 RepID=UPI0013002E74|nr:hypothetical protein [Pseudogemmobacter bohemicus]
MRDTPDSEFSWNDFVDSFNSESEVTPSPNHTPKPIMNHNFARLAALSAVKSCAFCGCPMPPERVKANAFGKGQPHKYCSDHCRNDYNAAIRQDKIRAKNKDLTRTLASVKGSTRDKFLFGLLTDHIRFRIGAIEDRTERNLLRRQSEAISNSFLFGKSNSSNVYNTFIAWSRATFPEIANAIYDTPSLLTFARENGIVPDDFKSVAPVMVSFTPEPITVSLPVKPSESRQTPESVADDPILPEPSCEPVKPVDEQTAFSAVIAWARDKKKEGPWIEWVFAQMFGHSPEGLNPVAGLITPEARTAILKILKSYSATATKPVEAGANIKGDNEKEKSIIKTITSLGSNAFAITIKSLVEKDFADLFDSIADYQKTIRDLFQKGYITSTGAEFGPAVEIYSVAA